MKKRSTCVMFFYFNATTKFSLYNLLCLYKFRLNFKCLSYFFLFRTAVALAATGHPPQKLKVRPQFSNHLRNKSPVHPHQSMLKTWTMLWHTSLPKTWCYFKLWTNMGFWNWWRQQCHFTKCHQGNSSQRMKSLRCTPRSKVMCRNNSHFFRGQNPKWL